MKVGNAVRSIGPATPGEKNDLYYTSDEYYGNDDEDYSDDDNSHPSQYSPYNAAHLVQEKRRATKRVICKRNEVLIQELEQEVERLSGKVQRLQEKNDRLRIHVVSLDANLGRARTTTAVQSSRAVYILRRFHQLRRENLMQNQDGEGSLSSISCISVSERSFDSNSEATK
jgi:hypothetical protein